MTRLALAIEDAPLPKEQKTAAVEYACAVAVEGRAPFLAHTARVLDQVIAMRRSH